jgi:hypothetical protein
MDKYVVKTLADCPKKKPKSHLAVNINAKQRASKYPKGTFHVEDGLLFCSKCNIVVDHVRKSTVDDHLKSKGHNKANSNGKQKSIKTTLKATTNAKEEKIKVCHEWIYACAAANIPLLKSDNPSLREFLTTRVQNGGAIPGSSQLRDQYLFYVYLVEKEELKQKLSGKKVALLTDELSDDEGRYVMDVLAVILDFDELSPHGNTCAYLLDTHFLTSTNNVTVSQTVIKVVNDYNISFDDVLIFNSDNVAYMKKAFSSTLSVIFPNCVHITCHSHIVNLVISDFKKTFPEVTEFVKLFRNLFYVPSGRKNFLRKITTEDESVSMPPNATTKSWSAWLDSVLYHADRFMHYGDFISSELELAEQPSNSLLRLGEIFKDEMHLLKLKIQMAIIKNKAPILLVYLDYFQMKVPHVTQAYNKMNQLLAYLNENTNVDFNDLPDSLHDLVLDLEIDEQDVLERQFESAFKQAEAKLQKYIVDGGQPVSDFLKEVRVLDPRNIVSSSKRHSSYSNIPGFKDTVTNEEWQKYVNILGPDAVSESENGKVDLKLFWKSNASELPELYKFVSCYCTGTLGSYDVERSFSSYNSILDSKRRNLNEQTLKAIHFLNWNLRVKNSITDESTTPKPVHEVTKKSSRHLSTKLPKPGPQPIIVTKQDQEGRCQEKPEVLHSSPSTSNTTPQQTSIRAALDARKTKLCSQSLTSQENRNQEKVTIHNSPPRSKIATPRRISIKEAIKQKSVHDSKCCYLCQREVSYGHKCSKCKRIVCTFPACCSIEETSNDILHICTAYRGDVGIAKEKEKQPNRNKRK